MQVVSPDIIKTDTVGGHMIDAKEGFCANLKTK